MLMPEYFAGNLDYLVVLNFIFSSFSTFLDLLIWIKVNGRVSIPGSIVPRQVKVRSWREVEKVKGSTLGPKVKVHIFVTSRQSFSHLWARLFKHNWHSPT
jgi:hypothetical protein